MKNPLIPSLGLAVLANVLFVTPALAAVNIAWVPVGNAGNTADSTGYGSVGYAYNIGKYEVTNAQYADFLNAMGSSNSYGIYNSSMASYGIAQTGSSGSYTYNVTGGLENRPVVFVSWYDAARFANWLGNGQGSGSMETGAYTLSGNTGIITVNPGATVYIPSEDEWYKAAYYNDGTSTYSRFPNGQNSITTADANYNNSVGHSTDVGSYGGDPSSYGTFDQGGNVWEWNDRVYSGSSGLLRGQRGGSWYNLIGPLVSSNGFYSVPSQETFDLGFRVASIPEPTSLFLTILASGMMLIRRNR
jgi:formylglycine-generating enzyme required for sulfatase activity